MDIVKVFDSGELLSFKAIKKKLGITNHQLDEELEKKHCYKSIR